MPRLENWVLVLKGDVYDDEKGRFRNGEPIITSAVKTIEIGMAEAQTRNTLYKLGKRKEF